jgi:lipopolysaccharide export system permease protein
MKILDKYIANTVYAAIGLVSLLLIGLQLFILFVNELNVLGKADFGFWQALIYVFLHMPYQVYLFFPMASLLGCLIGLGVLATHSELIVMRASGVSIGQVIGAVLKASLVVILIVTALGETIVPQLSSLANDKKAMALSKGQALRTQHGVWMRINNDFVSIGKIVNKYQLANVFQYKFDDSHHLKVARHIDKALYHGGAWQIYGVEQTQFLEDKTNVSSFDELPWDISIKPLLLNVASNEPDEMNIVQLYRFIKAQKQSHQRMLSYELVFWQRVIQPVTTCVMMFLAIPFIFGPLRQAPMGARLLAGAGVGFGFHILNRFFGPVSQVFLLPPFIGALGPTLLFTFIAFFMMRRVR